MDEGSAFSLDAVPEADETLQPAPLRYTNFARRSTLRRSGGRLFGSFSQSFSGACAGGVYGHIEEGAIINTSSAGRCSGSNEEVVRIDHN